MSFGLTPEQLAGVEQQLHRADLRDRLRERLEMVRAAGMGQDAEAIAHTLRCTVKTVEYWLRRFTDGGMDALTDGKRSGRPAKATEAYLAEMKAALEMDPWAMGLGFKKWTSAHLSVYLEQRTGIHICPSWLRTLIVRSDLTCASRTLRCTPAMHPLATRQRTADADGSDTSAYHD